MTLFKREGRGVYIKQPRLDELDYVAHLWSDDKTMIDVGGVIAFPKNRRIDWYSRMVKEDGKNFYCLIYTLDNKPVGEVSFHRFDSLKKTADFNIKIEDKHRGKGYGKEAMGLILDYYFNEYGGETILDHVINEKGKRALESFGFEVLYKDDKGTMFKMTKDEFNNLHKEE